MGTKFIATHESLADARYKQMLVDSSADDILLTTAFTGLQTNMLRPSIAAAGLDPDDLPQRGGIDIGKDIDIGAREAARRAGATSGAPGIPPRASPRSRGSTAWSRARSRNTAIAGSKK